MSDAFTRAWLRRDTYIDGMTPAQRRAMRALCERFYEDGRFHERTQKQHDHAQIGHNQGE
jgi:hypothetical protein